MPETPEYPILIGLHGKQLKLAIAASAALMVLALLTAVLVQGAEQGGTIQVVALIVAGAAFLAIPIIRSHRFAFYADYFVKDEVLGEVTVYRSEISGYRRVGRGDEGEVLQIALIGSDTIDLPVSLLRRAEVKAWFEGVPDLDAQEIAAAEKRFKEDERFGPDPRTRRDRLNSWRAINKVSIGLVTCAVLWAFLLPEPYLWAVAAMATLPVLGLLLELFSRGVLRFGGEGRDGERDARPMAGYSIAAPIFALAFRFYRDCNLVDWTLLLEWATGLAAVTALYLLFRGAKPVVLVFGFLFGIAYWGSVGGLIDVKLDNGAVRRIPVLVLGHHHSDDSYQLEIASWGPVSQPSWQSVSAEFYQRHPDGDRVCVRTGKGVFGIAWYALGDC